MSEQVIRIVLVGESAVGKSSLLHRFVDDTFSSSLSSTIGVDVKFKNLRVDGRLYKLQIWDATGQERFRDITKCYYRGSHGIMVVYDLCSKATFDSVPYWLENVRGVVGNSASLLLVGNKCEIDREKDVEKKEEKRSVGREEEKDKEEEETTKVTEIKREVDKELAKSFATEQKMGFIETSAKSGIFVEDAFKVLVSDIAKKLPPPTPEEVAAMAEEEKSTKKKTKARTSGKPGSSSSKDDDVLSRGSRRRRGCFCFNTW